MHLVAPGRNAGHPELSARFASCCSIGPKPLQAEGVTNLVRLLVGSRPVGSNRRLEVPMRNRLIRRSLKEEAHVTHCLCLSTWTCRCDPRDVCVVFRQCRFPARGDRARQVSRYARRLQRLPHAGIFLRQTRHDAFLGGSEVGFEIPGLGVFHGPNLTPDQDTGLGNGRRKKSRPRSPRASDRTAACLRRSCPGTRSQISRGRTCWRSRPFSRACRR